jgi:hypothetical protein
MQMFSFCARSIRSLRFIIITYAFEYPRRGADKIDDGSFRPIILWIGFVWHNGCYTSSGHDLPAGRLVLPHKVDCELRPVHHTFIVDICGKQVRFWRYPARHQLYTVEEWPNLLIRPAVFEDVYRTAAVSHVPAHRREHLPLVDNASICTQSIDASVLVPDLLEHPRLTSIFSHIATPEQSRRTCRNLQRCTDGSSTHHPTSLRILDSR